MSITKLYSCLEKDLNSIGVDLITIELSKSGDYFSLMYYAKHGDIEFCKSTIFTQDFFNNCMFPEHEMISKKLFKAALGFIKSPANCTKINRQNRNED